MAPGLHVSDMSFSVLRSEEFLILRYMLYFSRALQKQPCPKEITTQWKVKQSWSCVFEGFLTTNQSKLFLSSSSLEINATIGDRDIEAISESKKQLLEQKM